jgi:hypothetical protein
MKMIGFLVYGLALLLTNFALAQTPGPVMLRLKNNGLLPREFKFLEKQPGIKPDNVFTAYILPGQSHTINVKVGASLAQVTQPEIRASMRGQDVTGKPLLTVKAEDNGRIINLVNR